MAIVPQAALPMVSASAAVYDRSIDMWRPVPMAAAYRIRITPGTGSRAGRSHTMPPRLSPVPPRPGPRQRDGIACDNLLASYELGRRPVTERTLEAAGAQEACTAPALPARRSPTMAVTDGGLRARGTGDQSAKHAESRSLGLVLAYALAALNARRSGRRRPQTPARPQTSDTAGRSTAAASGPRRSA